jgi:hypothetical protein
MSSLKLNHMSSLKLKCVLIHIHSLEACLDYFQAVTEQFGATFANRDFVLPIAHRIRVPIADAIVAVNRTVKDEICDSAKPHRGGVVSN